MTVSIGSESTVFDRILNTVGELPTPPHIVSEVLQLTSDLDSDVRQLAAAVLKDQAITAKVLRLANSPFYGRSRTVESIAEAIGILGYQSMRSIVLAANVRSVLGTGGEKGHVGSVWLHSLAAATGARVTACRVPGINAELAYLGGLMKEIGTMLLLKKMPTEYGARLDAAYLDGRNRTEDDIAALGFTHLELGARLLERWNVPDSLATLVRYYEDVENLPAGTFFGESVAKTLNVVHFAGELAESIGYGLTPLHTKSVVDRRFFESLSFNTDTVETITSETVGRFEHEKAIMCS